jgi:hypothetical protein
MTISKSQLIAEIIPTEPSINWLTAMATLMPTRQHLSPSTLESERDLTSKSTLNRFKPHPLTFYTSQPDSLFLSLPAELRLQIYTYLLHCPSASALRSLHSRGHVSSYVLPKLGLHPSILAACKQTYNEARSILYTSHVFGAHPTLLTGMPFLVDSSRAIHRPPKTLCLPPDAAEGLIKRWSIQVRLDVDARFSTQQATAAFSGAEELEIEVWQAMFGAEASFGVLKKFEGVRGVRKCRVLGRVDEEVRGWLVGVVTTPVGCTPAVKGCWREVERSDAVWSWGGR